jgi:two-component system LytT family sensor kinase
MELGNLSKKELYRHLAIWLCLTIYIFIFLSVDGPVIAKFVFTIVYILNFVIPYYIILLYIFPKYYDNHKMLFLISYFFAILFFVAIDYAHFKVLLPFLNGHRTRSDYPFSEFLKVSLIRFSLLAFASTGAYMNRSAIKRVMRSNEEEKNAISKELSFLSNQFHSHLTYNFMSFCHGHLMRVSEKAAHPFEYFSQMLHYSFNLKPGGFIPLRKEIDYIENFIKIQRCITTDVFVNFTYSGEIERYKILQGIFSVFAENAFKHGNFSDPKNPVSINIEVKEDKLFFCIQNKIERHKNSFSSGIGLANVKQALEIFYNSHSLNKEDNKITYKIELTLKLDYL